VPETSRPGLRNAALRLEVVAEILVEHAAARDRLNYRRQVLSARDALERIGLYLDLDTDAQP
jgi:hypothetical protein